MWSMRHVVVVADDGVQHFLARLAVALGQLRADLRVAAFHLVVGRLADVVQQAAAPGQRAVQAELVGHHARTGGRLPELCCSTFWL